MVIFGTPTPVNFFTGSRNLNKVLPNPVLTPAPVTTVLAPAANKKAFRKRVIIEAIFVNFIANPPKPMAAAVIPATMNGKNTRTRPLIAFTIPIFRGSLKKFKSFISNLPTPRPTKKPIILKNKFLTGFIAFSTPPRIKFIPFLSVSKVVSLFLLFSFSCLLCISRNLSYSNFSCA